MIFVRQSLNHLSLITSTNLTREMSTTDHSMVLSFLKSVVNLSGKNIETSNVHDIKLMGKIIKDLLVDLNPVDRYDFRLFFFELDTSELLVQSPNCLELVKQLDCIKCSGNTSMLVSLIDIENLYLMCLDLRVCEYIIENYMNQIDTERLTSELEISEPFISSQEAQDLSKDKLRILSAYVDGQA